MNYKNTHHMSNQFEKISITKFLEFLSSPYNGKDLFDFESGINQESITDLDFYTFIKEKTNNFNKKEFDYLIKAVREYTDFDIFLYTNQYSVNDQNIIQRNSNKDTIINIIQSFYVYNEILDESPIIEFKDTEPLHQRIEKILSFDFSKIDFNGEFLEPDWITIKKTDLLFDLFSLQIELGNKMFFVEIVDALTRFSVFLENTYNESFSTINNTIYKPQQEYTPNKEAIEGKYNYNRNNENYMYEYLDEIYKTIDMSQKQTFGGVCLAIHEKKRFNTKNFTDTLRILSDYWQIVLPKETRINKYNESKKTLISKYSILEKDLK